jgi:hypothetical protein
LVVSRRDQQQALGGWIAILISVLYPCLPFLEGDVSIAGEDGMLLEVFVVAFGEVVAVVGAAAFGAGQG